ncbi:MAG TPA: glycerol kinase GlpK [Steroidobacteraceae bacterium]|jgi:glycerol kinase|nr:glycerol kinase GlpK [Steroidobacteraceae bacterium]
MGEAALLAIDQGTSSSRAMAFSSSGELLGIEQQSFESLYPAPGWVEHDPEVLWATVLSTSRTLLGRLRAAGHRVIAIGLTNQRETSIVWNRRTGAPIYNAIVWQDRRTAQRCRELARAGHESLVAERTGLRLDPYFSATKLAWILDAVPGARSAAQAGELAFGTVDSFLLWRLTGGKSHLTDASNASRTALYDIREGCWDTALCELFAVPPRGLPQVRDSAGDFGTTAPELYGELLPIRGVAGDQQAALLGQGCLQPGDAKCTYGTGAFLVANTGEHLVSSSSQLISTIAWRIGGRVTFAIEGSILSAGSIVKWLRDALGLFTRSEQIETLAGSVTGSGGVHLIPAFTGLGAPYWDPDARAALLGLTPQSGRAEIARAALESVVYQSCDLIEALAQDGVAPALLKVDGGMARNSLFCQLLADMLNLPVLRPRMEEASAFGAACLAGLGQGTYRSLEQISTLWQSSGRYVPRIDAPVRAAAMAGWRAALRRVRT